jgi:adenine-specific DNA methylase
VNFKENESLTKLRGGYYTPGPIANFLTKWVLNKKPQSILEPGCGDGSFIRALDWELQNDINLTAIELLAEEAVKAEISAQSNLKIHAQVLNLDFLEWALDQLNEGRVFDAVIGNPPYIRYQYLETQDQNLSEKIFKHFHLPFTKHTNAWVPFVIASIGLLAPAGRLAMVIPSELLHILHAGSLRNFLLSECSQILMIDPNELLFEEALQGTLLLMVTKKTDIRIQSDGVAIIAAPNNDFLLTEPEEIFSNARYVSGDLLNGKWMKVLLENHELVVFENVKNYPAIKRFSEIASVDVGIVTGANKFFLVDDETVRKYQLQSFARPMFGRSEHCPGVIYSHQVHQRNSEKGLRTNFIMFEKIDFENLPQGAQDYIREGEQQKLHTRYKCRIRKPWYSVPSVYSTNLGMLKRSYNYPRLILNDANAFTTDTAYRIQTTKNPISLVYCFINSLTALTAEMEGRHYGGGVLELVPSEIEKLLIPEIDIENHLLKILDREISMNPDPDILLANQDKVVLKSAGLSDYECGVIHEAWLRIRSRRHRLLGSNFEEEKITNNG